MWGGRRAGVAECSEHVWFWGSSDASDAIDTEECTISITKSSGDYLDSFSSGEWDAARPHKIRGFQPFVFEPIHMMFVVVYRSYSKMLRCMLTT